MDNNNLQGTCQPVKVGRIYFIRCLITNMYYVGQTTQKVEYRITAHKKGKKQFIDCEIKRIGWDGNFEWGVLEDNIPAEMIDEREIFYIKKYDCLFPKGYNKMAGGKFVPTTRGRHRTEEEKRHLSELNTGENHPMYGKKRPEHSARMSGAGNPFFGRKHTEETKNKIRLAQWRRKVSREIAQALLELKDELD